MKRVARFAALVGIALIACVGIAAPASGDGLPVPFDANQTGVANPGGDSRYATVQASRNTTVVLRIGVAGGEVERWRLLNGVLTVPAVAYDGSASGLSADGKTLILIRPRIGFPRSKTQFAVLETNRLRTKRKITLDGDFSFDAISPDGRTMYLIEYIDPRDPTAYQVRAYDLHRERLLPEPIVDPEAAQATMGGEPVTRETSPDGRWAYTLYNPPDRNRPGFIHALDTETGSAACIDIDTGLLARNRVARAKLEPSPDGATLTVVERGQPVAIVDTESFEVSEPPAEPDPSAAEVGASGSGSARWLALGLAALVVATVGGAIIRRGRRRRAVDTGELEKLVDAEVEGRRVEAELEAGEKAEECERVP